MKVIAYIRVSTEKQAEQGLSLEAQTEKVRAYCALYDHELVDVVVDAGLSAKTVDNGKRRKGFRAALRAKRPGLAGALERLEGGAAEALLVVKLDRLTRSTRDLSELMDLFAGNGWALLSVGEQLDTSSAAGRMVLNVLMAVLQWEREATSERTSAVVAYKQAEGEFIGGAAPFGYEVQEGRLVPHAAEQEVIRLARELAAEGLSLRKVGEELAAAGLLPRKGGAWHPVQVQRLLAAA